MNLRIDGAAGVHACGVSPDFDHLEVDAAVQVLDEYTLQLDTCPPNADCTGTLSQLHVDAPVFAAGQPSGLFVHVSAAWSGKPGGPCDQRVELKNLPSWGGEQNPLAGWGDMLWFYGEDGQDEEASDLPFTVSWASLLCGQSAHEVGLFTFTDKTEPMNQVTIGEANHAGLTLKSSTNGAYAIDLHDVRSAKNLGTPDYAFWAIGTPLKD